MKRPDFLYSISLLLLLMTYVVMPVNAQDSEASQEILQDFRKIGKINEHVQNVGTVKKDCLSCIDKASVQKVALDKSSVNLGKPLFEQDDAPVVIYLKRTSHTPDKVNLKFKNSYRYCEKTLIGGMAGGLAMGCLLYMYNDIDEEVALNLKSLPKLSVGQEEIIELKLTKSDVNNPKYSLKVKNLSNSAVRERVDEKFFGDGYNVDFKMNGAGE